MRSDVLGCTGAFGTRCQIDGDIYLTDEPKEDCLRAVQTYIARNVSTDIRVRYHLTSIYGGFWLFPSFSLFFLLVAGCRLWLLVVVMVLLLFVVAGGAGGAAYACVAAAVAVICVRVASGAASLVLTSAMLASVVPCCC